MDRTVIPGAARHDANLGKDRTPAAISARATAAGGEVFAPSGASPTVARAPRNGAGRRDLRTLWTLNQGVYLMISFFHRIASRLRSLYARQLSDSEQKGSGLPLLSLGPAGIGDPTSRELWPATPASADGLITPDFLLADAREAEVLAVRCTAAADAPEGFEDGLYHCPAPLLSDAARLLIQGGLPRSALFAYHPESRFAIEALARQMVREVPKP